MSAISAGDESYVTKYNEKHVLKNRLKMNIKMLDFLKAVERQSASSRLLSEIYGRLFYRKMVYGELNAANLNPEAKVLHIGCGFLPLTAIYLAKRGFKVTAIDCETEAIKKARKLLEKYKLSKQIELIKMDGKEIDYAGYEAVWISLNVFPKHQILEKLSIQLPPGSKVVYRNPRGWLKLVYCVISPEGFLPHDYQLVKQPLHKQSVVLTV